MSIGSLELVRMRERIPMVLMTLADDPDISTGCNYLSAWLLFTYGLSKLAGVQFGLAPRRRTEPDRFAHGFQLTWFYYSYSHVYASILGASSE